VGPADFTIGPSLRAALRMLSGLEFILRAIWSTTSLFWANCISCRSLLIDRWLMAAFN
jgi:hypothetical protein